MNPVDQAQAFDGKAEAYARHRLAYAPQAIDAIIAIAGLGPTSVLADLGAGTGMLTRCFAGRVGQVFAIEPNDDMRALALSNARGLESIHWIKGAAHATELPAASVDAVTAGRALQWFEPVPSREEIRRILRPGGWLIVVRTPVTDVQLRSAIERLDEERASGHPPSPRQPRPRPDVSHYFGDDNCVRLAYPCTAQETWPQFFGRMQSLSFTPPPGDPGYERFARAAREIFDGHALDDVLHVEYATEVLMKQLVPKPATPRSLPFPESEIEGDIVARFARVVANVPGTVALKAGDATWTYAELDELANRVAGIVQRESPDRAQPVALLFEQGIGGIASIMGVLKAGRAYCALDPAHPAARHRAALADLGATLLLCGRPQSGLAREIAHSGPRCVTVEPGHLDVVAHAPDIARSANDIAAIYYTSGTTGAPKGVLLSHRHLLHRAWLSSRLLEVAPGIPMSQTTQLGFANSATDIFVSLLSGATLCPFDARRNSLRQLADWLKRDRIAILRIPVALLHRFLDSLDASERFPHVRFLHPAGRVDWSGMDRYRLHFGPDSRLVRQLAATETSLLTTMMVQRETPRSGATMPVGYPVPGKEIWLEGENGARVPSGAVGEIVVRSRYLYSGIWRHPETFLPDGEPRVHHTGDLGRWLADGSLEFVGRADSRVKIRGHTIDLDQVEAALGDTRLVTDAAVVVKDDPTRESSLVAYVVPANREATPGAIRAHLTGHVPGYMIPSRIMMLNALPLTPNGKVDRAALHEIGRGSADRATPIVTPRTPVEARVCAIWADVLGIEPIGVDDDFLEIGGDSLTAGRIASSLLDEFKIDLTPRDLLNGATVAQLAELIALRRRASRAGEER